MIRTLAIVLTVLLLAGCKVAIVPVPVDFDQVGRAVTSVTEDERIFIERYEAIGTTYAILHAHLEQDRFDDPEWRKELDRLALEWHDSVDVLRGTHLPNGDAWREAGREIDGAMQVYGYAADAIEGAALRNDPSLLRTARSELMRGKTMLTDAMRILGK